MSANTSPIFGLTPNPGGTTTPSNGAPAQISIALDSASSTFQDNPATNIFTVLVAGAAGTRVDLIRVIAIDTTAAYTATSASLVRIFITNTSGSSPRLYCEIPVSAVTPSTTVGQTTAEYRPTIPLVLAAGQQIIATASVIASNTKLNIWAFGMDF